MTRNSFRALSGTPRLHPRCVALTFDDGPGPKTAELAKLLRHERVPATFFVLGENVPLYGSALDVVRDCGHAIGLHGDIHDPFNSSEMAQEQLNRCRAKVSRFLGEAAVWFRPPFGRHDFKADGYLGPVGWDADGEDWRITYRDGQTVVGCVEMIATRLALTNGGIVLLHDFVPQSELKQKNILESDLDLRVIEIAASLIERLRRDGFSFVSFAASHRCKRPTPIDRGWSGS